MRRWVPRYDEGGRRVRCSHRQPCCPYNIAPAESHTHVTHVAPLSFHRHASGARPYFIVFINPPLTCAQPGTYDIGTTATGVKPHDRALSSSLSLYVSDGVVSGFFVGFRGVKWRRRAVLHVLCHPPCHPRVMSLGCAHRPRESLHWYI